MYCVMQVVGAGSDTTRQALNVFIMAMIEHPEVFAKVRAEVDSVCKGDGGLRIPVIADIKSLHYTAATLKEVLRWRPMFLLSPEHTVL